MAIATQTAYVSSGPKLVGTTGVDGDAVAVGELPEVEQVHRVGIVLEIEAQEEKITDAAMSERAECVMLDKGPHIADAIETLDTSLTRMQHHQHKKRRLLRRLQSWDRPATTAAARRG